MKKEKGQSLIEVLVALAVAIVVVLALVRVTTTSVRNAAFARNQALATKYAQETIEKIRAYRDETDWTTFINNCESPPGLSNLPPPFSRTITCSGSEDDKRNILVEVSWVDAHGTHKSELKTRLTNWR